MIKAGDTFVEKLFFKQEDVIKFAEVTGDCNPIHLDEEYAAKTFFKRPIVHGFLSGAVFSKVFGTQFPGEGTIYLYQEMKFLAPVFVNEQYIARFEVMEVNTEKHLGVIKCILETESGQVCIDGMARLKNNNQFIS